MATSNSTKAPCCKCNKGSATFTCDGCRLSFCLKHASDHRQELSLQMDNIGQQHDILKRDIDQQNINKTLSTISPTFYYQQTFQRTLPTNYYQTIIKHINKFC